MWVKLESEEGHRPAVQGNEVRRASTASKLAAESVHKSNSRDSGVKAITGASPPLIKPPSRTSTGELPSGRALPAGRYEGSADACAETFLAEDSVGTGIGASSDGGFSDLASGSRRGAEPEYIRSSAAAGSPSVSPAAGQLSQAALRPTLNTTGTRRGADDQIGHLMA